MHFEIQAKNRHEFDEVIDLMKKHGMNIQDLCENNYRVLAKLSKRQKLDLENRGYNLRGMRDCFYQDAD